MVNQLFTHSPVMPLANRRQSVSEETHFGTLKLLQDNPGVTQRTLAKSAGYPVAMSDALNRMRERGIWLSKDVICFALAH
jgi:hypothetical protein